MLPVYLSQRGEHPRGEVVRIRVHHGELHAPPGDVQGVANALRHGAGDSAAHELGGNGEDEAAGVLVAGVAGEARQVLHAAELEVFEAVEGEAGVRHHAHEGGREAAVEGARPAFLLEDGGGGVCYAAVDMLACYLRTAKIFFYKILYLRAFKCHKS